MIRPLRLSDTVHAPRPRRFDGCAKPQAAQRGGLTLLEVVVALAIFLFSIVAISQLVSIGGERALDVQLHAKASMLCQRELDKRAAGIEALGPSSAALADEPDWQCEVDVSDAEVDGLKKVKVTIKLERQDGRITEATLSRLVMDPSLRGSSLDQPAGSSSSTTEDPAADAAAAANQGAAGANTPAPMTGGTPKTGGSPKTGGNNGGSPKTGGNNGGSPKTGGNTPGTTPRGPTTGGSPTPMPPTKGGKGP
jgi:hypothetical protein